jgi:hypothetical protein
MVAVGFARLYQEVTQDTPDHALICDLLSLITETISDVDALVQISEGSASGRLEQSEVYTLIEMATRAMRRMRESSPERHELIWISCSIGQERTSKA